MYIIINTTLGDVFKYGIEKDIISSILPNDIGINFKTNTDHNGNPINQLKHIFIPLRNILWIEIDISEPIKPIPTYKLNTGGRK